MSYFAQLPENGRPLRVALIGAGSMGRVWAQAISDEPRASLVAVADIDEDFARSAMDELGITGLSFGSSVADLADRTEIDAVVNVTVPGAHFGVNAEALTLGYPVLCEKPIVPSVTEAIQLAALAEDTGRLLMTSQSRRYFRTLFEFNESVEGLGEIGYLSTDFHTGPHFGGFREEMENPLLLDMAIHAFDAARYVLDADPVSVYCDSFNPSWSWFRGDASAVAIFEMRGGARYVFTGSWCNKGLDTSWNGSWIARGAEGSSSWDGSTHPIVDPPAGCQADKTNAPEQVAGALREFIDSLRTGTVPYGNIHSNVWSLAMVEAAVASADSGVKVDVSALVEKSYAAARDTADVTMQARLSSWDGGVLGLALAGTTTQQHGDHSGA